MAIIDVSHAQAGMVLAADALNKRGQVLIPAGRELTEKHVSALPAWGVHRIEVEGDDVSGALDLEEWAVEAATTELGPLFSLTNRTHPAMVTLIDACTERRAAQIQAGEVEGGDE